MPTATQSRAERDIASLEGQVRDAKTALEAARKPFLDTDGEVDVTQIDARSEEFKTFEKAGLEHDRLRDQLHAALSVTRVFDRDAKSDELQERGEGVGPGHQGTDRGFKAALDRMYGHVEDILRAADEEGEGGGSYAKAAAKLRQGSEQESVGSFALGELADRDGAKTLITRGQGGLDNLVRADRGPLVDLSPFESYTLLDLISTQATSANSFEYPTFLGRTGSAAIIPDPTGTTITPGTDITMKPDIGLGWGLVTDRIRTLAAGIPIHRNSLDDIPLVKSTIEGQLPLAIRALLQAQALNGSGSGENLLGVRNRSGITTVARNSAGSETNVDAIHRTLTQVRLTGDEPSSIALNPTTFEGMRLSKNVQGDYYYGAPAIAGATTLWGKLVITDINVATTEALCVDWSQIILMIRSGLSTRASDSHLNYFMLNLVQFLCEGRFGLKVPRPSAIGKTTTLA